MSKEKLNICLVNTVYSFFLYLLINGYDEKDIFIFTDLFPKDISKNVRCIQLPMVFFVDGPKMASLNSINGIIENIHGYCKYFYGYLKLRVMLFVKTFNKEVAVYGHAHTPFSYIFYENADSNIIEDGLMNYTYPITETHKINRFFDKLLNLCGIYFLNVSEALGSHKNIKNVYLTQKNDHPLIKKKVKIIDLNKKWANLSSKQKINILNIFNIPQTILNVNCDTVIILTQPFSDDNLMTFDEEIKIYREMIKNFNDYKVIIKPHPRDKKNYHEFFNDIEIWDRYFPIELIELIGLNPSIVASIASTAVLCFKKSKIYIYDGEIKNKHVNKSRNELIHLIKN